MKRTPGVAVFYDESIYGVPHALVQLVSPDYMAVLHPAVKQVETCAAAHQVLP